MKKHIKLLCIFILIVLPRNVLAASEVKSHILSIENFAVNESNVKIEGYAFISHVDNVGGVDGNLKNYIMAYTGSNWNSSWNNPVNCVSSDNCYVTVNNSGNPVAATVDASRSLFYSRCTGLGCHYRNHFISQFSNSTSDNNCSGSISVTNSKGKTVSDSDCLYEGVGFSQNINLDKVNEKLGNDNIKFRLVTVNTDYTEATSRAMSSGFAIYSGICTVNDIACGDTNSFISGVYNLKFSGISKIATFDATFAQAFDATFAKYGYVFFKESASLTDDISTTKDETKYNVLSWAGVKSIDKTLIVDENGNEIESTSFNYKYSDSFFRLDSEKISCESPKSSNNCYDSYTENGSTVWYGSMVYPEGYRTDGVDVDYYAPANFITLDGELSMDLIPISREYSCDNVYDGSASPKKYFYENYKQSGSVDCTDAVPTENLYQCDDGRNVTTSVYLKVPSDFDPNSSCSLGVTDDNKYIIINISTDVIVRQDSFFRFDYIQPTSESIKAGKGFNLSTHTLSGKPTLVTPIYYQALLDWTYAKWYYSKDEPYLSPETNYHVSAFGNACGSPISAITLLNNNKGEENFYYKKADNTMSSALTFEDAAFYAIDLAVQNTYYKAKTFVSADLSSNIDAVKNAENVFNESLKMNSCDSNYNQIGCSEDGELVDVNGNWDLVEVNAGLRYLTFGGDHPATFFRSNVTNSVRSGRASWYVYTYKLPNAYLSLADSNDGYDYGDIAYEDKASNNKFLSLGNKYFVSYKYSNIFDYNGFDWPFNLKNGNPSLVDGMNWSISGTCGVNVNDGYYKTIVTGGGSNCDGGNCKASLLYKYRSISLSNPFPKFGDSNYSNAAINWQDWYWGSDSTDNRIRLSNSYYHLDYAVSFFKSYSGSQLDVGDIVNCGSSTDEKYRCSNSYGSLANFSVEGSPEISNFVFNNFNSVADSESYCRLGRFSKECDKYNN